MRRTLITIVFISLVSATAATASWARSTDTQLGLVGYAVPREALGEIIKTWQKTPDGSGVDVTQSYGASGDQARAVANGLPADIVQLSTGLDVDYLVEKGLVDKNWDKQSSKGIVTTSLVVFAVRPGNPKKIKTWNDLVKPGVEVITANPFTSGAAKWNILAAYGAQRKLGKTDKQGRAYAQSLFRNVVVQAKSGRDATNAFLSGKGDVLLTYENEALLSRKNGQDIQFTIPKQSMLIEAPIAVLKTSKNRDKANQFIRFTKSDTAQRIWAEWGFRPVSKKIYREYRAKFPARPTVFRISDPIFGGWAVANRKWFDPKGSIMVDIEKSIGGPTG
ncbi:MAG: sulfate ABC transporter substrate-binding protein [Thermoleophilia bacterium]|nr:sulfate ABC transporter substrate-binding protein [Thermoleophilia bacterium]